MYFYMYYYICLVLLCQEKYSPDPGRVTSGEIESLWVARIR